MRHFDEIFAIAAERHGGARMLEEKLPMPFATGELVKIGDDRILSIMSQGVFQAGFNWKVIEKKWPGFEEAFCGFNVGRCAMMDDAWFDQLLKNKAIVRHAAKIKSVPANAAFLIDLAVEHGSAAAAIAQWPDRDFCGLLDLLHKRGSRLGGTTGAYALRRIGKPGYVLSRDVVARLMAEGVIDTVPSSMKAKRAVQAAFNEWMDQSGRSLTEISRVLAMSIG